MQNQQNKTAFEALLDLRCEIDEIDEKLISLLIQRMSVIEKVGVLKKSNQEKFFIRANREADMIKTLVKKSGDILPKSTVINIWRKIITTANMHEQPLQIAICNPQNIAAFNYLTKDYYSELVPLLNFDSANNTILTLEKNEAQIAIFALPKLDDEEKKEDVKETWWISLANNKKGLKIFAKIPFFEFDDAKKNNDQIKLVAVAAKEPEKSSSDSSFLYVEAAKEISKNQILSALKEQNLSAKILKIARLRQIEGMIFYFIELDGFYLEEDQPIKNFNKSKIKPYAKILGHCATPIKV